MIEALVEGAEMIAEAAEAAEAAEGGVEIAQEAAEVAQTADAAELAGQESLAIDDAEREQLESIAAEGEEEVSVLGERKHGWCMRSICQGEFSSFACSGCIGKASNHKTKR